MIVRWLRLTADLSLFCRRAAAGWAKMSSKEAHPKHLVYRFGIVTALPKEFAAVRAMLDELEPRSIKDDPNDYLTGTIPSADGGGAHRVVVTLLKKTGNNSAAAVASHLIRSFPTISDVLMVGIAGGVANPNNVEKHVRLGDIVISIESGVVQYDNGKLAEGKLEIRDTSQTPSAALVGKVKYLEAERIAGRRPWEAHFDRARNLEGATRPPAQTDPSSPRMIQANGCGTLRTLHGRVATPNCIRAYRFSEHVAEGRKGARRAGDRSQFTRFRDGGFRHRGRHLDSRTKLHLDTGCLRLLRLA
jgi:nucleoside phosphorylase